MYQCVKMTYILLRKEKNLYIFANILYDCLRKILEKGSQNLKFSIKDFFSKYDQLCRKLRMRHIKGASESIKFVSDIFREMGSDKKRKK